MVRNKDEWKKSILVAKRKNLV